MSNLLAGGLSAVITLIGMPSFSIISGHGTKGK